MIHFRIRYDGLRLRLGSARRRARLVRAAWLALVVPLGGFALFFAGTAPLAPGWWGLGAVAVFALAAWWLTRPAPAGAMDRDLDRRFGLNELLVTAVEVDRRGARTSLDTRLLDDAATAVAVLGGGRAIDERATRREAETFAALGLILAGLWLLAGTLAGPIEIARLPGLGPLDGPGSGPGDGGGGDGDGGAGDRNRGPSPALGLMAGALGDHAAARDIADALAAGDPAAAARAARALADRAEGLSQGGQDDLAETLRALAEDLAAGQPELAKALADAASALDASAPATPAAGIEQLAAELDAMAIRGASAGALAPGAPRERTGPPAARLVVAPTEAPLAKQADRRAGATTRGRAPAGSNAGAAIPDEDRAAPVVGGAARAVPTSLATDPLRYPWPLRDAVRAYFTPADRREGGRP